MIRYFNRNETNFNHNETILNPISCYISEEANGLFELEAEFAKNTSITEGDIIKAPCPRGEQLFRIYRIKKSLKGKTAYARHIFYDLSKNLIVNLELSNVSGFSAIQSVLSNCETSHNFVATSDILTQNSATYTRINPIQAIIGDENSILNLYGGNLIRDNFSIYIKAAGTDRGYEIRMGKNLIGIDADIDESNVKTRIYPTVVLGDKDTVYALPEKYVNSPLINHYGEPIIYTVDVKLTDDQKQLYADEQLSMNDIYDIMRNYCNELFENDNIDKPVINYKVDFVELSKTEQYKDLAILEQLDLYDIVTVNVSHLDINVKARVVKYKYDCLKERYDTIELGDFSSASNYTTAGIVSQITNRIKANESAIEYATNVITGNKGGYVVIRRYPDGKPYEILIMDSEDINTAKNVLRINNSGIGFSQTGYNGTYGTAITLDSHIVADYVDTGTLTSILLKSANYVSNTSGMKINLADGTIDSKNLKADVFGNITANNANLNNGTFKGDITGGTLNINNNFVVYASGKMKAVDGDFSGNITGADISGSKFTSKNDLGNILIEGPFVQGFNASGDRKLYIGYDGSGEFAGNVQCNTLNGYIPITKGNIDQQSVSYAISSGTASTAISADYLNNCVTANSAYLTPLNDAYTGCGSSYRRWSAVFAASGTIVTSDKNKKNTIQYLEDRYLNLAKMIIPKSFKMNEGTSGRTHLGFIAQEVEEAMIACGISDTEFAGLVKAPIYAKKLTDKDGNELEEYDPTSEIIGYDYALRYDEFIPLLYSQIALLKNTVSNQQEYIENQSDKINELERRISKLEAA